MDGTTGVRGRPGPPDDAPPPAADAVAPVDDPAAGAAGAGPAEIGAEETRFAEFVLGAVALVALPVPGAPGGFLVGQVAVLALVGLSVFRHPTRSLQPLRWLPYAAAALLGYLVLVSVTGPDVSLFGWPKRALRLALVLTALLVMVSGRVHFPSLVRGMAVGLLGNAVLFFAGVAPAPYGGFLSGYLLDKNQAGLAYTVVGILLVGVTTDRRRQVAVLAVTSALVWTTGSRTSLAALACALAWFVLRPRLNVPGRLALAGVFALVLPFVEERYAQVGQFADRVGSDEFRARIDAASLAKLDHAPWHGQGLGEAWVMLADGKTYFFHNSYWAMLVEGGWVYLVAMLVGTVWFGIRPLRPGPPPTLFARSAEAANLAVLVCALRLGEVFGATTAVVALAAGLIAYLQAVPVESTAADPATVSR
jgi:O-antigen ligase